VITGGICNSELNKTLKIGILGGIGPEASGKFYLEIINKLQKSGKVLSNKDFPQIIINSIPAPELINGEINNKDLEPYIAGLKELESNNVDFIVMVCNTIHVFHKILQSNVKVEIIDLKKELQSHLKKQGVKKISVFGTPFTISHLYNYEGFEYISFEKKETEIISAGIYNFNTGNNKEEQIKKISEIAEKKIKQGAEKIILACSEISLMLKDADIPKIDTMEVLADAVIRKIMEFNL